MTIGGELVAHGLVVHRTEEETRAQIAEILYEYMPSVYIIEAPVVVRGDLGDRLQQVISATKRVVMGSGEWIQPSDWKQLQIPLPTALRGKTAHERDAYRMCQWWLRTRA